MKSVMKSVVCAPSQTKMCVGVCVLSIFTHTLTYPSKALELVFSQ